MKLLIVGLDGLGSENIETFGMVRLLKRMQAGTIGNPQVAYRMSRGWPEIFSGTTAEQSGAYYQIPVRTSKGRVIPTQKTGLGQVEKTVGVENMLWNRLTALGYDMSVMTVPTVTKPLELPGFSIAATGGGKFGNSLGAEDLFPADLLRHAMIADLDLGLRMGYGGFLPSSLANMEQVANKHLSDYFQILRVALERRPSDAMFMASRFINEMSYKFTALINSDPTDPDARALRELILALCDRFDSMLDKLIEELAPENLFVVSDHGICEFKAEINLNEALVDMGLLQRDPVRQAARQGRHAYKRMRAKQPRTPIVPNSYRFEASKAFSIGYIDALYLTDQRFGGPSMDAGTRAREAETLANQLNDYWSSKAPEAGVTFSVTGNSPYSGNAETAEAGGVPNPDILCHTPRGTANEKQTDGLISTREFDFGKSLYQKGFPGEFSGVKSSDTFAGYVGPHADAVTLEKLTDLYGSILAVAERAK
ncbi:Type I phosphodiesterase / nucleotide pyrophosphatase [Salipiger thiooxidans]|uniref:Type I phosphodiesterase / nucleotide pyrophosphatase n=1 Tax=Salipiger thiooxidans TaxID=282683 RepID=A0A1G7LLN5_9RHOB|nr:alkaline phosphatase family protein [Salipiger thiooxidans]SDF50447.1 Type I phosphodiesterase / nucleotide pyrophosphatase [Salipiger thiooxidans]